MGVFKILNIDKSEIEVNFEGMIDDLGFFEAAFQATTIILAKKIPGWESYVMKLTDGNYPVKHHILHLMDNESECVAIADIWINGETEKTNVEYQLIKRE